MPNFVRRAGGVDAVGDGADRKPGHVGNEIFKAGIAHDGDAIARFHTERKQAERKGFDFIAVLPPRHFLVEAEILVAKRNRVWAGRSTFDEELRHALCVNRPGPLLVMPSNLVPIRIHAFGPPAFRYNGVLANHRPGARASRRGVASVAHHRGISNLARGTSAYGGRDYLWLTPLRLRSRRARRVCSF